MAFPRDRFRIYKRHAFGRHVDLFLIDTRQYRSGFNDGRPKHIMDETQMRWLLSGLKRSKARWKVVANQVVVTADPFGTGESVDQWDGFPDDRTRLLGAIEAAGLTDVVFVTGDAHVFLCSLLGTDFNAVASDPNRLPAAVEYVGGSVTSPGSNRPEEEARTDAPWIQQFNGADHGYAVLGADGERLVTEYRRSDLTRPDGGTGTFERFTQPAGVNRVSRESARAV
jgi:phosphodiesterase/alkaline phosphatase D-like protein